MSVPRKYSQPPQLTSTPRPCRKTTAILHETFDEVSPIFPVPRRKTIPASLSRTENNSLIPVAKKSSQLTKLPVVKNAVQIINYKEAFKENLPKTSLGSVSVGIAINKDAQRSAEPPKVDILKSSEKTKNPVAWVVPSQIALASTLSRRTSNVQHLAKRSVVLETVGKPEVEVKPSSGSGVVEVTPAQLLRPTAKKSATPRSTLKAIAEEEFMNMSDEDKIQIHNMNNISRTFVLVGDSENKPTDEQVPEEVVNRTQNNLLTTSAVEGKARASSRKRNVKSYKEDDNSITEVIKRGEPESVVSDTTNTRKAPKRKCAVQDVSGKKMKTTIAKELENSTGKNTTRSVSNKKAKTSIAEELEKSLGKKCAAKCVGSRKIKNVAEELEKSTGENAAKNLNNRKTKNVTEKLEKSIEENVAKSLGSRKTKNIAEELEKSTKGKCAAKSLGSRKTKNITEELDKSMGKNAAKSRSSRKTKNIAEKLEKSTGGKCTTKSVNSRKPKTTSAKEKSSETFNSVSITSVQSTSDNKGNTVEKSSKSDCENKKKSGPRNAEDKAVIPKAEPVKKTIGKRRVYKSKTDNTTNEEKLMETSEHEVVYRVQKVMEKTVPNNVTPSKPKTTVKRKPQVPTEELDHSGTKQKRTKKTHPNTEDPDSKPVETNSEKVDNHEEKRENEQPCKSTVLREKGASPHTDGRRLLSLPLPLHESDRVFHVKNCFGLERAKLANYVPGVEMRTLLHINNYVMTGKMLMRPRAIINTASTNTTYFVTQGVATVTIMSTKMVITSQDERNTFFIPKGADFSIVNESRDYLKLLFTKFKD